MAMLCCLACRSQPTIFISASFVPSLFGWNPVKVYSGRREADVLMSSPTGHYTHDVVNEFNGDISEQSDSVGEIHQL